MPETQDNLFDTNALREAIVNSKTYRTTYAGGFEPVAEKHLSEIIEALKTLNCEPMGFFTTTYIEVNQVKDIIHNRLLELGYESGFNSIVGGFTTIRLSKIKVSAPKIHN